jgi:molybdopterin molybdotransferase
MDMPPFAQSAMDGYAFRYESLEPGVPKPVSYAVQAGMAELSRLRPGEAARIFTGAPVPEGADTVVMQEKTERTGDLVLIRDPALRQGANVRPAASQTQKGELAARAGTRLGPGAAGFLAGLGIAAAEVFANPETGIIITGKELVPPGQPLQMGQVYESNSVSLRVALAGAGIVPEMITQADDEAGLVYAAIEEGLACCRLLLITGGISVGDYDFVHEGLKKAGVQTIFYKVRQKPGKPLYCGRRGDTLVFGLPGNPGSVLSCFYQYVVPAIRQMKGMDPEPERKICLKLSDDFSKKPGLTHFLKGRTEGDQVVILHAQESYKLNAFVESDCVVRLEEEMSEFRRGDLVRVYPLNRLWD